MLISMTYDLQMPGATQSIESLMLRLLSNDMYEIPLSSENPDLDDKICYGELREVNPLVGGRLVELVFRIDDEFGPWFVDEDPLVIMEMV